MKVELENVHGNGARLGLRSGYHYKIGCWLFEVPDWSSPDPWRSARPGWVTDFEGFRHGNLVIHRERWFPTYERALADFCQVVAVLMPLNVSQVRQLASAWTKGMPNTWDCLR